MLRARLVTSKLVSHQKLGSLQPHQTHRLLSISSACQHKPSLPVRDQAVKKPQQSPTKPNSQKPSSSTGNPSLPAFSLEGLGATRAVKIVVYTAIGILATSETIFYTKWIYHYFYPLSSEQPMGEDDEE